MHRLLLLILAVPFFVNLEKSSVWDANEAFYVQTPREMLERGDWTVPHFNGQPRVNKPPLSYWIVGTFYRLFGVSVVWERIPMALLAYGSVLILYWIGRMLLDPMAALWGAGIFATTFRFLMLSRRLFIDILLLFCLLAAIAFFISAVRRRKRLHLLLSALFFGLGFLAKGPVCLLPLPFLALYAWMNGRARIFQWRDWSLAALLFGMVGSSWFLLLGLQEGIQAVQDFFLRENLGRYTDLDYGPQRGAFFFAGVFLADFFPWSILFAGAGLWLVRKGPRDIGDTQAAFLLLAWVALYLGFFSLSTNKQEYYILPAYPAAALLVALYLREVRPALWLRSLACVLTVLTAALAAYLGGLLTSSWWQGAAVGLPLATLGFFLLAGRVQAAILSFTGFYTLGFLFFVPALEAYKPIAPLASIIEARLAEEPDRGEAGYYKMAAPSLAYYLNRPILELEDKEQALHYLCSERTVYLITSQEGWEELRRSCSRSLEIVAVHPRLYTTARTLRQGFQRGEIDPSGKAWTRPVYLITNQPSARADDQRHRSGL